MTHCPFLRLISSQNGEHVRLAKQFVFFDLIQAASIATRTKSIKDGVGRP